MIFTQHFNGDVMFELTPSAWITPGKEKTDNNHQNLKFAGPSLWSLWYCHYHKFEDNRYNDAVGWALINFHFAYFVERFIVSLIKWKIIIKLNGLLFWINYIHIWSINQILVDKKANNIIMLEKWEIN